jgi:hypothetical protein
MPHTTTERTLAFDDEHQQVERLCHACLHANAEAAERRAGRAGTGWSAGCFVR